MSANGTVTLRKQDDISLVILDDGKVNAFNQDLIAGVDSALDSVPGDVGALVIAGRPGVLSGGFDLKVFAAGDAETAIQLVAAGSRLLARVFEFPRPVVVACTGHAPALAALLLLTADYRVGAEGDFVIGLNEVRDRLVIPRCLIELTHFRVPPPHHTKAVLHSEMFHPAAAERVGFLDEVVAPETVLEVAMEHARRLAELPHPAYGITKRRDRGSVAARMYESLETELAEDILDMVAGDLGESRTG